MLDVRRRQRRSRRAGRALCLHHQPQFREPPGPQSANPSRQPRNRCRERHRRPNRRCARARAGSCLMQPFTNHTAIAAPLIKDDVNTDQIAPIMHSRGLKEDYRAMLFHRARRREDGSDDPQFVLNKPQFREAGILVSGENFGAGSSRESAVWSMLANGFRVIVAKSFADIYRENCLQNGVLPIALGAQLGDQFIARVVSVDGQAPFTVDLLTQRISGPGGSDIAFEIPAADRTRLIEGLDDIGLTLKHTDQIANWEARAKTVQPWLQSARDSRRKQG